MGPLKSLPHIGERESTEPDLALQLRAMRVLRRIRRGERRDYEERLLVIDTSLSPDP